MVLIWVLASPTAPHATCRAPQWAANIHLANVEALYPSDNCDDPFLQVSDALYSW